MKTAVKAYCNGFKLELSETSKQTSLSVASWLAHSNAWFVGD